MPDSSPFHESQKLVRCQVANRYREASIRFIEIDAFKLWEYLMTTKHGLKVGEPSLCLWVADSEYGRNANVFEHAGEVEPVDRIVVDLFDHEYGFSQTTSRYASRPETDRVVQILRSHIPADLCNSEACDIRVVKGQVVRHAHPKANRNILMGLQG
ncbi:MAG: hypothetical protein WBM63_18225 [Sedimenticolaceae bacterium]|jgi:hypothetical protein